MTIPDTPATPVLVVGGGASGMAQALALHANGVACALVDARPRGAARRDARVLALSHGSKVLLEQLGVWQAIPSTAIETIDISQQGGNGHAVLRASELRIPALGHVVSAADLCAALDDTLSARGIPITADTAVETVHLARNRVEVQCANGPTRETRLVIHAEGTARHPDGTYFTRTYGQHAVVTTAYTAQPHGAVAWERFTPHGPLAMLPHGEAYAVVCTTPDERLQELMGMSDADFTALLQDRFGPRLDFTGVGERATFPLGLRMRRALTGTRQAWVGNAAQTLHPVAGQGFNLGLRDAWELARLLREAPDPGAPEVLARYARSRQPDRWGASLFTHALIEAFSNDHPVMNTLRGAGLAALDLVPPARSFVARRMIWGARAWP